MSHAQNTKPTQRGVAINKTARRGKSIKKIRFEADPNTLGFVRPLVAPQSPNGSTTYAGLVIDESHSGCRIAFLKNLDLKVGQEVNLKVGHLSIHSAHVRWLRVVTENLIEAGFEYSDL